MSLTDSFDIEISKESISTCCWTGCWTSRTWRSRRFTTLFGRPGLDAYCFLWMLAAVFHLRIGKPLIRVGWHREQILAKVVDSVNFGLPQRRRRLYILGSPRKGQAPVMRGRVGEKKKLGDFLSKRQKEEKPRNLFARSYSWQFKRDFLWKRGFKLSYLLTSKEHKRRQGTWKLDTRPWGRRESSPGIHTVSLTLEQANLSRVRRLIWCQHWLQADASLGRTGWQVSLP